MTNSLLSKCRILTLCGAVISFTPSLQADEQASSAPPQPWTQETLNKLTLDALPDIDWTPIESGDTGRNAETVLFQGENTVSVWNAGPAKLILDDPLPYDEFVVVLKGKLTLTDKSGNSVDYKQGDMFMLPKGFTGIWDMTEEYRELIVIDTKAYNEEG